MCAAFLCLSLQLFLPSSVIPLVTTSLHSSIHHQAMLSKTVRWFWFFCLHSPSTTSPPPPPYQLEEGITLMTCLLFPSLSAHLSILFSLMRLSLWRLLIVVRQDACPNFPDSLSSSSIMTVFSWLVCVCVFPACVFCFVTVCEHSVTSHHRAIWDAEQCLHQPVSVCLGEHLSATMVVLLLLFWCRFPAHSIAEFSHYSTG